MFRIMFIGGKGLLANILMVGAFLQKGKNDERFL